MATVAGIVFQANTAQVKDAKRDLDNLSASARTTAKTIQQTGSNVVEASTKFRPMKGALTQASFQLQDVAVQAQAGTNAFTILGQQGPQIASIFGPGGAVAGALIAFGALIGGVLYKTLGGAAEEVDRLEEAMKGLEEAFQRTEQGSFTLSQRLKELAQNSRELAEIELAIGIANAKIAFEEAQKAIVTSVSAITTAVNLGADAFEAFRNASDYARGANANLRSIGERVKELETRFGLTTQQALDFGAAFATFRADQSAENLAALQSVVGGLGETLAEDANPELLALVESLSENLQKADDAADALEMFGSALNGSAEAAATLDNALSPTADKLDRLLEGLREEQELYGASARAKALYTAVTQGATAAQVAEINALFDAMEMTQARLDAGKAATEKELADKKAADARLLEQEKALTEAFAEEDRKRLEHETMLARLGTQRMLEASDMLLEGKSDRAQEAARLAINLADAEKRENAKQIISDSYSAAMKAYKSLSGIPIIGPALGAAAAGAIIAAGVSFSAKSLTGRALGGQVRPGESYVVGERGPEVLTMGNAGGRVTTNEAMRGGSTSLVYSPTVNISGGATEQDRALFTAQLRQQKAEIADLLARRRF
jgi:hypothetical protein